MNQRQTEQQRQFGGVAINRMFFGGQTVRAGNGPSFSVLPCK